MKTKNCNMCEHIDGCAIEILNDNLNPDKYVCENSQDWLEVIKTITKRIDKQTKRVEELKKRE